MQPSKNIIDSLENVSRETLDQLQTYVDLLLHWNKRINLVDRKTENAVWNRHIIDSAQLVKLIPQNANSLIDYGSGAGLPGIIIGILRPNLQVRCCERDQRKAIFLQEARRSLALENVTIFHDDVANIEGCYDVVTARAFTALQGLLAQAIHHLAPEGICFFPKGKMHAKELEVAQQHYNFQYELVSSETDEQARILVIRDILIQQ